MLISKIEEHFNNINSIAIVMLFILFFGCSTDVSKRLADLEHIIKSSERNELQNSYSPPSNNYYPAMKEWIYWYRTALDEKEQKMHDFFVENSERGHVESIYRSFRDCVHATGLLMREKVRHQYKTLYSEEGKTKEEKDSLVKELEAQEQRIYYWITGGSDTLTVFDTELDAILKDIEAEQHFFKQNCERWQPHVNYLREQYGIEVKNLPCDIESIKKINGLKLLEKLEEELVDKFNDSLAVVLSRKEE